MTTLLPTLDAMLALLRACPSATLTATNSAIDDTRVMISESTPYSIIVDHGGTVEDTLDWLQQGKYTETHLLNLWVCYKRGQGEGGDAAQKQALRTLVEGVKDYLRPYETLNGAPYVIESRITETGPADYSVLTVRAEVSTHIVQRVTVRVQCVRAEV